MTRGMTLELSRDQILGHRVRVNALDGRLPPGPAALRRAAWAGLQDSMPRAALLSIRARVRETEPDTWEDPSLVQLWGPRFSAYVVAAADRAPFTLGRLPDVPSALRRASETADRLDAFLAGRRMTYGEAGRAMGIAPNALRYAAPTGRVLIRWDGARQPVIWTVPPPDVSRADAALELARRYLHVLGPGDVTAFAAWAGVRAPFARSTFDRLGPSLLAARTPVGEGFILAEDEASLRTGGASDATAEVRLLPSGDAYFLLHGAQRALLVPDPARRAQLWTPRVWPGALLLGGGEIAGTWRRADADIAIEPWRRLNDRERQAVVAEAESLPLPGLVGRLRVRLSEP